MDLTAPHTDATVETECGLIGCRSHTLNEHEYPPLSVLNWSLFVCSCVWPLAIPCDSTKTDWMLQPRFVHTIASAQTVKVALESWTNALKCNKKNENCEVYSNIFIFKSWFFSIHIRNIGIKTKKNNFNIRHKCTLPYSRSLVSTVATLNKCLTFHRWTVFMRFCSCVCIQLSSVVREHFVFCLFYSQKKKSTSAIRRAKDTWRLFSHSVSGWIALNWK